jgi:hypothetical protein
VERGRCRTGRAVQHAFDVLRSPRSLRYLAARIPMPRNPADNRVSTLLLRITFILGPLSHTHHTSSFRDPRAMRQIGRLSNPHQHDPPSSRRQECSLPRPPRLWRAVAGHTARNSRAPDPSQLARSSRAATYWPFSHVGPTLPASSRVCLSTSFRDVSDRMSSLSAQNSGSRAMQ